MSLKGNSFNSFLQYYNITLRSGELEDLKSLVEHLNPMTTRGNIFHNFYIGYKIPQIAKEFDLLRFGKECVINIELKSSQTEEKIKKQLIRNKYYLSYIRKKLYNLSYESDTKKIYFLADNESLEVIEPKYLVELLCNQELDDIKNIDDLFNPSDYLVSPFNSTDKFLNNKYFLTHQQEEISNKIIKSLQSTVSASFISIKGGAGTGKTLLVYDIVKNLIQNGKKSLIIHCGNLNQGQIELNRCDWNIIAIKNYSSHDLSDYDVIVIDEAQRIYPAQLKKIVESITKNKLSCIFSYDKLQTLLKREEQNNIDGKIEEISQLTTYKLSEKIRTNKEIANFTKMLFNNKRKIELSSNGNIEVNYFQNLDDAKNYLISLDKSKWEVLNFTPSQYDKEFHQAYSNPFNKTSHNVIGQEFDGVAITIDRLFTYEANGELFYNGTTHYHSVKMLFQNITRARKRLNLVIIDNEELLNRCMSILQ